METIFTKIIKGQIPSVKLYEDHLATVILDIAPANKGHTLVISNEVYPTIASCPSDVLQHLIKVVKKVDAILTEKLGCDATNVVINNGAAAGQEVPHLHIHVIPRYTDDNKKLTLPKESYKDGELNEYGLKLRFEEI